MKKLIYTLVLSLIVLYTFTADNCKAQGWSSIGSGMNGSVTALTVFNNELIAGGWFTTADGVSANRIAKWNGTNWVPLGSGMDSAVQQVVVFNNELIAGGLFLHAGGVSANRIAKWNGVNWAPLGSGMDSNVYVLGVYNGELIAGGNFITAGGLSANRMAKWNGIAWAPLGSGISSSPSFQPGVYSLTIFNNELVVSGEFTIAGGVPVTHIAKWNGTNWSAFTTGVAFHVSCIGVYNNEFIGSYVLGYYMAKWTGTIWSPLGNEITGYVKDFTTYNNELIAGGIFYHAGIDTFRNIGKWNGTSWSTLGSGLSNYVYSLTVFNNDLIVGGAFTTAGGVTANYIAKWGLPISIQPISSEIPSAYSLSQNYPNPFNPVTKIRFDVVRVGDVKLVVYDVMGREIQTLVNERLQPGTYETTFDGSMLNSGVYFYRLSVGDFTETRRMLMVK